MIENKSLNRIFDNLNKTKIFFLYNFGYIWFGFFVNDI